VSDSQRSPARAATTEHEQPDDPEVAASAGMLDAVALLRPLLNEVGVRDDEIDAAAHNGSLHMLALDRLLGIDPAEYTLDEVAMHSGLQADSIRAYWRALGFPDPRPNEKLFSANDLEMLARVQSFIEEGALAPSLAVQMARVIGSNLARIATAQIEAIERAVAVGVAEPPPHSPDDPMHTGDVAPTDEEAEEEDLAAAAQRAADLLPMMPGLMEFVWRRHLGAAARRRILRAVNEVETQVVVGFADLVGFTAQTQQLPEDELAEVVGRFESIAYDVVAGHAGRVVKTLGDEVMFTCDDVKDGALIASDLASRYRADEALSDVRVGLALGDVLERDGDVFGPVVNLAHRIVTVAYPATVVVSPAVHDALEADPDLEFKSIRSHYLKDIGRIPLWTLRRADEPTEVDRFSRAKKRQAARRQFFLDLARSIPTAEPVPDGLRTSVDDPDEATTEEYEALADAVLGADISPDLQVELLTDIEAGRRLHQLEEEASQKAEEADLEAERKLDEIELEARRRVQEAEKEAHLKVERVLQDAEDKARRANEAASRKVKRAADEAERKADRATKEAKRDARRRAARRLAKKAAASAKSSSRAAKSSKSSKSSGSSGSSSGSSKSAKSPKSSGSSKGRTKSPGSKRDDKN
jgi:adenylate cyclase